MDNHRKTLLIAYIDGLLPNKLDAQDLDLLSDAILRREKATREFLIEKCAVEAENHIGGYTLSVDGVDIMSAKLCGLKIRELKGK